MNFARECFNRELPLTYVKDEGVAEGVVSIVTSVDQELRVGEHSAAVPAATHTHTHTHTQFNQICSIALVRCMLGLTQ